jgi:hypothetical protein
MSQTKQRGEKNNRKCADCFLFLKETNNGHRAASKSCPCRNEEWLHPTWHVWESYFEKKYAGDKNCIGNSASADAHALRFFWEVNVGRYHKLKKGASDPFSENDENAIMSWYTKLTSSGDVPVVMLTKLHHKNVTVASHKLYSGCES